VLDLGAERTRYLRTSARGFASFAAARFDVVAALRGNRLGPVTDTAAPVPGIARMQAQATAAGLRLPDSHTGAMDGSDLARARFIVDGWRGRLAERRPPSDWNAWLQDFATVERLVHGAARGTAREGFYDSTRAYLDRANAPATVRAVVDLRHALAAWDFPAAVRAGEVLQPTVMAREGLYPPDEYLDAMVTANLMTGDVPSAGRIFGTVGPLTGRSTKDFRMLLLASYLRAMERMNNGAE